MRGAPTGLDWAAETVPAMLKATESKRAHFLLLSALQGHLSPLPWPGKRSMRWLMDGWLTVAYGKERHGRVVGGKKKKMDGVGERGRGVI